MSRQAYHITENSPDADHIKVTPLTWYNVGAVQSVYLKAEIRGILLVNTQEQEATALGLHFPDDCTLEDEGRTQYVKGAEGMRFVTDDGVQ